MIDRYKSLQVCIASKHGKEQVIARLLFYALGRSTIVRTSNLSTTQFAGFVRERLSSSWITCRVSR
jgi:hypothetical protein